MHGLIDISFLTSFCKSSRSDWEKYKVGSPIDGAVTTSRYSVHTEKETDPFVVFRIPLPFEIHSVRLNLRSKYAKNSLPIKITGLCDNGWIDIGQINKESDLTLFSVEKNVSEIKVVSVGKKSLDFSSVNIYVEYKNFVAKLKAYSSSMGGLVFTYTDFFGLGGKLSVVASALAYLGAQSNQKNIICDKSLERVLDYPKAYKISSDEELEEKLDNWGSKDLVEYIRINKYKGTRNISLFYPTLPGLDESPKFTFISRNRLEDFSFDGENEIELKQRIYKRMIPSAYVLEYRDKLKKRYPFDAAHTIGVHVRHGNGELYFREFDDFNRWGVKPPDINRFIGSIESKIKYDSQVNTLILCSDSYAARDLIKKRLGDKVEVLFVSENIQDVGCGCNHTPKVFNTEMSVKKVDRSMEDCVAFSEMLLLSECKYLVGGSSFFFDAVIGFSDCPSENITQFSNKDRYARLGKDVIPIVFLKDQDIKDKFKRSGIPLDGVFIANQNGFIRVSYFDEEIILFDSKEEFMHSGLDSIKEFLGVRRGY